MNTIAVTDGIIIGHREAEIQAHYCEPRALLNDDRLEVLWGKKHFMDKLVNIVLDKAHDSNCVPQLYDVYFILCEGFCN